MAYVNKSSNEKYEAKEIDNEGRPNEFNWQVSKLFLHDRFLHLHNNKAMSNVTFIVKDVRIPAHKLFLATSSPVFEAMFYGQLAPQQTSEVEIPDFSSPKAFVEFLKYFYVGESNFDKTNMFPILYLAKKYIVAGLEESCRSFIQDNLETDNVFSALEISFTLDEEEIKNSCMQIICYKMTSLVKRECFYRLRLPHLAHILKSDAINIREVELFVAIEKWCEREVERRQLEGSNETKRSVLGDALYSIRFPLMAMEDFLEHCAYSEILSPEESRDLLCYISLKGKELGKYGKRPKLDVLQQQISEKLKFPKETRTAILHPGF